MIHRILHLGEKKLRQVSEEVTKVDDDLRQFVKDMFETMVAAKGVGLAAPQLGVNKRLFVIEIENKHFVFINPKIVRAVGKENFEEGCLSIPGLRENVQRSALVIAAPLDLDGNLSKFDAEGLRARAIQHELDHLDGVLFIDRISKARRFQLKRELERIEAGLPPENEEKTEEEEEETAENE